MIAVADGVGGWATKGVDPAIYSRRLCKKYSFCIYIVALGIYIWMRIFYLQRTTQRNY